jgi:hypothetical protein
MQTFLPYANFRKSVETLDYRRLGKQRVEAFQLLVANKDEWALSERTRRTGKTTAPKGWVNHPAAIMWRHYNAALKEYYNLCIEEWVRRGYNNTMQLATLPPLIEYPYWLGNKNFHASHRSNLLRKNPKYYSQFNWKEKPDLEYIWPCDETR